LLIIADYSGFLVDQVRPNKLNSLITRGLSPLPVLRWHENRYNYALVRTVKIVASIQVYLPPHNSIVNLLKSKSY